MGVLADLVESAFDLYAGNLVTSLSFAKAAGPGPGPWQGPSTDGWATINAWIRKGS